MTHDHLTTLAINILIIIIVSSTEFEDLESYRCMSYLLLGPPRAPSP